MVDLWPFVSGGGGLGLVLAAGIVMTEDPRAGNRMSTRKDLQKRPTTSEPNQHCISREKLLL